MYNSRPRVRRFTSEIEVPENYSGNAFREEQIDEKLPNEETETSADRKVVAEESVPALAPSVQEKSRADKKAPFRFDIGRFFGGSIGFEELLILGLILLVAQNEGNEDILLLLVLLLFVG